jgi:6-phosphogluconate dehydrogenase
MEINEFQKRLTDEACLLRGKIIAGYSLVEYVLADISVRLDLKFPYRIKDRIKAVKQIVDRPSTKPIETTSIASAMSFFDTTTSAISWLWHYGSGDQPGPDNP